MANLSIKPCRRIAGRVGLGVFLLASLAAGLAVDPDGAVRLLAERRLDLLVWVRHHYPLAVTLYILGYVVGVALSLPLATWATLAAGFLFGTIAGTVYTVIGSTLGATAVFLAGRFVLGDALRRRAGRMLGPLEPGLRRHAFNYLVVLRMLPIFPFWVVNLAPAVVGMRLSLYVAATLLGVIPGSLVFASLGAGLGGLLAAGRRPGLEMLADPQVLLPLLGLSVLALLPVAWARWTGKRDD